MNMAQLLEQFRGPDFFEKNRTVCFKGDEYPYLFFALCTRYLKHNPHFFVEALDAQSCDFEDIIAKLEMSFLGRQGIYWIRNANELDAKKYKKLRLFLQNYQGPHRILFFAGKEEPLKSVPGHAVMELPDVVTKQLFMQLLVLEYPEHATKCGKLVALLFAQNQSLSLDTALVLMRYIPVIGTSETEFIKDWLSFLVEPDKSLFTLSTHFFAKDSKKFFVEWIAIRHDYAEPFWATFWSEQLWRAANFIQCMKKQELVEAKKIGFRLPFSFMQRDWKKTTVQELRNAHKFVYDIDYSIKNGGEAFCFDLLYSSFFLGNFTGSA